ncbi:MAG: TerB family tellurite resistance protein [Chromatiales bacterium]|nr:TerB family tellurite resistance protein [Chromatiales bacterium]
MLSRLRQFLEASVVPVVRQDPAARVRLAVAALLVELARADHDEQAVEHEAIAGLIARHFQLDSAAADELLAEARSAVDDSVSLREFTAPIHQELSYGEKQRIIGMLWDVALEDRTLDKYEDYLIGKVAELLYVSRGDVIRLRFEAGQRRSP